MFPAGFATDGNGKMYFKNGKYGTAYVDKIFYEEGKPANGWYDDGSDWYFFKNGKKYTGFATDGNGKMYFKDGKYGKGYVDKVFYGEGKPADWWYDDGTAWYFFQKGEKFTGIAKDTSGEKYFVDGKYGSGIYNDILSIYKIFFSTCIFSNSGKFFSFLEKIPCSSIIIPPI